MDRDRKRRNMTRTPAIVWHPAGTDWHPAGTDVREMFCCRRGFRPRVLCGGRAPRKPRLCRRGAGAVEAERQRRTVRHCVGFGRGSRAAVR